jgi:hypothetical protein
MNHKLLQMLNEAGFEFTPDIMNKLPAFENLVWLEREACAVICENYNDYFNNDTNYHSTLIRARGQHGN